MKRPVRRWLASMTSVLLVATQLPTTAVADPATTQNQAKTQASETSDAAKPIEGPFAQWNIPTPPGAENYQVNQVEEKDLNPKGLDKWEPTQNPNSKVTPGKMRSDREEVPAGISKETADAAEVKEAKLRDPENPVLNSHPECKVYWPTSYEVCGLIRDKYDSIGGPMSFLLLPITDELTNPDGVGKRSRFINGYIYYHPRTGAHTVSLPVDMVWSRHNREQGFLGYPKTSDVSLGNSWYQQTFEGGYVYTHNALPPTQASIKGSIYDKWQSMGAQKSALGFPISDELVAPDGVGRYNVFEHGVIYWTPQHGAHPVSGTVLSDWSAAKFAAGTFGYPIEDPSTDSSGLAITQKFEKGIITGYAEVVQKIADATPGAQGQLTAKQVYEDGMAYAKQLNADPVQAFSGALKELLEHNKKFEAENNSLQNGLPDGDDTDPINPRNRGDIFYSDSTTKRVNHGHNGIFVGGNNYPNLANYSDPEFDPYNPDKTKLTPPRDVVKAELEKRFEHDRDKDSKIETILKSVSNNDENISRNDTVEASGVISDKDNAAAGVKRRRNYDNSAIRATYKHKGRLRNVRNFEVNTSQEVRDAAANYARDKAHPVVERSGAAYNYDFAFNRRDDGKSYNCSQLVWAAYGDASKGKIDLDSDGGFGVYPMDIRDSKHLTRY